MRPIDADALKEDLTRFYANEVTARDLIDEQPTVGGWINNYEWICPACGSKILVKTSKQSKALGVKLSVCPVCGKEILYGKAD